MFKIESVHSSHQLGSLGKAGAKRVGSSDHGCLGFILKLINKIKDGKFLTPFQKQKQNWLCSRLQMSRPFQDVFKVIATRF